MRKSKHTIFSLSAALLLLLSASSVAVAQQTEIYRTSERLLEEGINLYKQQHYAASQNLILQYLQSPSQANTEVAEFYYISGSFSLRRTDALKQLQSYLQRYPYTTYSSDVNYMIGTLLLEKRKFKQANKYFEQTEYNEVSSQHQPALLFYRGYCLMELHETKKAAVYFGKLKDQKSLYRTQAQYYFSYCQYALGNYGKALPGFLDIENNELYRDIVPYYIVQIYYQMGQYDEVYARAERLLAIDKDGENTGELHRMLGEIYYQQGKYDKAQEHLLAYEQASVKQNKELLREDLYLLGMAFFKTGDYEKAILFWNKVKKENDLMTQNVCMNMGQAYIKLGHTELAKLSFAAAMRYDFDSTIKEEAMYNYALTTYQSSTALGESVTAFTDFLKAYPDSKHSEHVWELLTDVFLTSKNYQAGYDALCRIEKPTAKMQQTKQYLRYQLGAEAYMQNKNADAIDRFTEVINNEAGTSEYKTDSYYWRAEAYYHLRDYQNAENDIAAFEKQKNVSKNANRVGAKYLKGYVYFSEHRYEPAQKAFSEYLLNADPASATYSDALNRIGDCHFSMRQFSKAENCYAQVVAHGSTGADYAMFQRGYALGLLKRYNDKINVLEKLVKQYPRSDYADDALYEIARAELMRERNEEAIKVYEQLLTAYPNSNMARKAAFEKGMIYYNIGDYENAIIAYKQVIKAYPQSEEAYSALESLQAAYVETNNISEYLAYTKTLNTSKMHISTKEDSLTYVTAERQYMLSNFEEASVGFKTYISNYCSGGRYCTVSTYYLASCYYQLGKRHEALVQYKNLCEIEGNPYMEEACMRAAEITYDNQDYQTSLEYFKRMQKVASTIDKTNIARLGILRCSYLTGDNHSTISIATEIIDDITSKSDVIAEARYNRGKAFMALKQYDLAIADLKMIATDLRKAQGAEAKYLCAQIYYDMGETDAAQEQIMDFAQQNTPHQYWLARSFVLLSDICVSKDDIFQAKQYLLSLKTNYKPDDDIQGMIDERLKAIEKLEQKKEKENANDTDDNE